MMRMNAWKRPGGATLCLVATVTACGTSGAPFAGTSSAGETGYVVAGNGAVRGAGVSGGGEVSSIAVPSPRAMVPYGAAAASTVTGTLITSATAPAVSITIALPVPVPIQTQAVDPSQDLPAVGLLTAASVGDVDRRANYLDYLSRHADERETLGLDLSTRLRVRVVDPSGHPVANAQVELRRGDALVFSMRTHTDGVADVFPSVISPQPGGVWQLDVVFQGNRIGQTVEVPSEGDAQDVAVMLPQAQASAPRVLDLGFVIDVTGSMGDELRYVNHEIRAIVQRIEAGAPGVQVRVGATFYRDRVDPQPLQMIPFTTDVRGFAAVMQTIVATGGGDYPEDMNLGLANALSRMAWSRGDDADRVMVLIADAPPQRYADEPYTYRSAMLEAAQRGIRILPVAASGANRTVEYLFRAMGAFTSTPYTYLTDDSEVGGAHMEADTDRVAVERFGDLLTRLILADLQGQGMHEPSGG